MARKAMNIIKINYFAINKVPEAIFLYRQITVKIKASSIVTVTTVIFLSFRTDRSGQTVQTQIRLLLEEQSDQGLHCLQFCLHLWDTLL